jgi:amidase
MINTPRQGRKFHPDAARKYLTCVLIVTELEQVLNEYAKRFPRGGTMRRFLTLLFAAMLLFSGFSFAQQIENSVSGRWTVFIDLYGSPLAWRMELEQQGDKITGDFAGDKLEGTLNGNSMHFLAQDDHGGTSEVTATLTREAQQPITLAGTVKFTDPSDKEHPHMHGITGRLTPKRPAGGLRRHEFMPTTFSRTFSPANKPVLTVWPGDTIHTTTVDAGGTDEKNAPRSMGGNPETGPFFIETAMPGDMLVVHLTRVRLNRDYAVSDDALVPRAMTTDLAIKMKDPIKTTRWHLDRERGLATLEQPPEHLKGYSAPVRPMLGCIATAPNPAAAAPASGDSGGWGGNMDFNEIVEGATVYLPVYAPGALLYVGDGHALQGDGELNGNALETSMEVEFTVDVVPKRPIPGPRVESGTHIMAMGLGGSLDDAFRYATDNMVKWLIDTYELSSSEAAQVLGTSAEYKVSEVADRNAGIVLKISKEKLQGLKKK